MSRPRLPGWFRRRPGTPSPARHQPPDPGMPADVGLDVARGPLFGPEPDPSLLRLQAEQAGLRDGERRMFDEYSFVSDSRPPYLRELDARREMEIHEAGIRAKAELNLMDAHEARYHGERIDAEERVRIATEELAEAKEHEKALLDELGMLHSDGGRPAAKWVGSRARKKEWPARAGLVLIIMLLAGVEIPIHFGSFSYLRHPVEMTWVLAAAVSFALILGPHWAGHWARGRYVPGGGKVPVAGSVAIMLTWLVAVITLARFRQVTLSLPVSDDVDTTDLLAQAGFTGGWSVLMFAAVLLLSGAIAFMLGFMAEHPHVKAMRAVVAERKAAERLAGVAKRDRAVVQHKVDTGQKRRDGLLESWRQREEVIGHMFDAAEFAYRNGVAQVGGHPDITDAAGNLR
ncbi:hypothetical protein Acor_37550 [Acrocarpospora corrugata]|uniref:Uncharacterized protein n=1 Tax=Acrocarpospora corrugata TaxID=35763 RepID=A0A5M3W3H0_9ACTN|nr:hypothetical protein [Acrocarpospora corrugata]GES01691.1 hypothetical protein Acor_37550 [Acrocarpospora corrugata]